MSQKLIVIKLRQWGHYALTSDNEAGKKLAVVETEVQTLVEQAGKAAEKMIIQSFKR